MGLYRKFMLISVETFEVIKEFNAQDHSGCIHRIIGLKDGCTAITCSNESKLLIWNLDTE